jgi:osmotically-inducible protein OsmY
MPEVSEPDTYLCEHVHDALARDPRVAAPGLRVSVAGGRIFVSGDLPTETVRRAVSDVVAELFSGHDVVNATSVVTVDEAGTVEHLS